jgi:hypothetical protein
MHLRPPSDGRWPCLLIVAENHDGGAQRKAAAAIGFGAMPASCAVAL